MANGQWALDAHHISETAFESQNPSLSIFSVKASLIQIRYPFTAGVTTFNHLPVDSNL